MLSKPVDDPATGAFVADQRGWAKGLQWRSHPVISRLTFSGTGVAMDNVPAGARPPARMPRTEKEN